MKHLAPLFKSIIDAGGTPFVVGGSVRDFFLGIDSKDIDIEVHGLTPEELETTLRNCGMVKTLDAVGKAFGVFKVRAAATTFDPWTDLDISMPRTEHKTGEGHTGFDVDVDPFLGIEKALQRRDFSINAMAFQMDKHGEKADLIDPFNGVMDIINKRIAAVGPAFQEDPLRIVRAIQFACRFGFKIDNGLALRCQHMVEAGELDHISKERIWTEWEKIGTKGQDFHALEAAVEACGLQGRFGVIKAPRRFRFEDLTGERRVAVVLAAVGLNVTKVDVPNVLKTWITEIQAMVHATNPGRMVSRSLARQFKRATWSDVLRIRPSLNIDPWVLDGPLPLPVTAKEALKLFPSIKTGPWVGEMVRRIELAVDADPMVSAEDVWKNVIFPVMLVQTGAK